MSYTLHHPTLRAELSGTVDPSGAVVRYRGLKYASVAKRWTRSRLVDTLPAQVDARTFGPRCPQPDAPNHTVDFGPYLPFEHAGQDDLECLNLNVVCPMHVDGPLPVLFWIHGGALHWGAGSDPMWEPTPLVLASIQAGTPIVVITINYRLGPFGFLAPIDALDPTVQQGNLGFHDQLNALEWCQRHVAGFGGDPRRVTVGGESAGGCSTHAMVLHQERLGEQRFFRRAVMQSGNLAVMGFWDRQRVDQIWSDAAKELRLDAADALEQMRELPWQRLLYVSAFDINGYGVYTDSFFSTGGSFPESQPSVVDAVMHGDNADEGNIFRIPAARRGALDDLKTVAASVLGSRAEELLDIYGLTDGQTEGIGPDELARRLHRLPEDARFYIPSDELARVWPNAAFYHLTARSPFKTSRWPDDCYHTQDLLYLFGDFDHLLAADGLADHLRLSAEIKATWLRFIHGKDPWPDAFQGRAATFGLDGTAYGTAEQSRQWDAARLERMRRLKSLGFVEFVQLATAVFP